MCFWEAWRNVVHKLPSGVRVTYLGSTLEILVVLSSPAPWRHIRLICESKTYFCFCSCCYSLMIAHWWSPAAQICTGWKKAQYEASGVYFILGGSYSEVYSECFNSCSCRFIFFIWQRKRLLTSFSAVTALLPVSKSFCAWKISSGR